MIISEKLYNCAKVSCDNGYCLNIAGTAFRVNETGVIVGTAAQLVRCRIELFIYGEITPAFVKFTNQLITQLSNPCAKEFGASISIEYDIEY
jgi:hypothetical protein